MHYGFSFIGSKEAKQLHDMSDDFITDEFEMILILMWCYVYRLISLKNQLLPHQHTEILALEVPSTYKSTPGSPLKLFL